MIKFIDFMEAELIGGSEAFPEAERTFTVKGDIPSKTGIIQIKDDLHNDNHMVFYKINSVPPNGKYFALVSPGNPVQYVQFKTEHPNTGKREEGRKRVDNAGGIKKDLERKSGWTNDHIIFGSPSEHNKTRVVRVRIDDILEKMSGETKSDLSKFEILDPENKEIYRKTFKVLHNLIADDKKALDKLQSEDKKKVFYRFINEKMKTKGGLLERTQLVSVPSKSEILKALTEEFGKTIIWTQAKDVINKVFKELFNKLVITPIGSTDHQTTEIPDDFWTGKDQGLETNRSYFIASNIIGKDKIYRSLEPVSSWYEREKIHQKESVLNSFELIKFEQYLNENKDLDQQLINASINGNLALVKTLIKQGADIHADNDDALRWASYNGHLEVIKYLISKGVDINAYNDKALKVASSLGHLEVVKYLISQGADIHAYNDGALIWASYWGRLEVVKYLISQGANIHAENDETLRLASYYGHLKIVKYLISKGADIPKLMDIPEDVQEIAIKNDVGNIKNIKNLRADLKEKYKHLFKGSEFGLFNDD
jgi:hypothetical protein